MTTWLDVCWSWGSARGVPGDVLAALRAFGNPWPRGGPAATPDRPWDGSVAELADGLVAWGDAGEGWSDDGLVALLSEEVDTGQAAMFARRLTSVDGLLRDLFSGPADGSARLLRIMLRERLAGIAAAPGPRALRVRGLADFLYSRAGALRHHGVSGATLDDLVDDLSWRDVVSGLRHATLEGATGHGPLFVNLLEVDPARIRLVAKHCREDGTSHSLAEVAAQEGAVAATSGGFFLYSEPDIAAPAARYQPVGLLVSEGRLVSGSALARGALLVDGSEARIGVVGPPGGAVNRAHAQVGPDLDSVAVIDGVVVARGRALDVPLRGFVVPHDGSLAAGDVWLSPVPAPNAMAGGPILLHEGKPGIDLRAEDFWGTAPPRTFSQDETGDTNLLPRLGVGTRPDGTVVFAACDGRDLDRALGWTLGGVGRLLSMLGCTEAVNLDGGSSKRMVVDGVTVDLASTEVRGGGRPSEASVRPVQTAWLMFA
ncbi:MAG: phosphodiester glycosidase family protein [Deltaproteobacteria bacterium]|nr:phosphodiester glycosidase family protein [Deltaproteobacteria bacterium]